METYWARILVIWQWVFVEILWNVLTWAPALTDLLMWWVWLYSYVLVYPDITKFKNEPTHVTLFFSNIQRSYETALYYDVLSLIFFWFLVFFCYDAMNNAVFAPVKLPSSMVFLCLCCARNVAAMLCQCLSYYYCNSVWSLESVKLFYYALMVSRRDA